MLTQPPDIEPEWYQVEHNRFPSFIDASVHQLPGLSLLIAKEVCVPPESKFQHLELESISARKLSTDLALVFIIILLK